MNDCIYCKIIAGELPSQKVYEDDIVVAFLDINPVNHGHTLVVPKEHFANLYETPDKILCHMMEVIKKLSITIKSAMGADGINLEMNNDPIAGQVIFHTHIHIVPRLEGDGLKHWPGTPYGEGEWEATAEKIKKVL